MKLLLTSNGISNPRIQQALVETCEDPPSGIASPLTSEEITFTGPDGAFTRTFVTARGAGLVDVSLIPHLDNANHPDASSANAPQWAAMMPGPTYAIDDMTALTVVDGVVSVVSEGHWKQFEPT